MCHYTSARTCARFSSLRLNATSKQSHQRRKAKRCRIRVVFAIDVPPLLASFTKQHQPAFPYFLHNPPPPPQNPTSFLQTSLSKILGNLVSASLRHDSPRISDER